MLIVRAHRLQALDVLVDRTQADRAAARQRHLRLAAAREQRTQHQDRGAHRLHQLVGRDRAEIDASALELHRIGARASTATPICASSAPSCATSCSRGTLVSGSGSAVSSAAHRIGSAAFFAPETRTSPSSARAAVIAQLVHAARLRAATLRASASASTARGSPRACGRPAPRRRAGGAAIAALAGEGVATR